MTDNDFEEDMEQLAADIAVKASDAEVTLHDQIDAFRALMPYLVLLRKNRKNDDNDEETPSFDNFQAAIRAVK